MTVLDRFSLRDKVIVLTGGSGLYGLQLTAAVAEAEAKLVIASRNLSRLEAVAKEENGRVPRIAVRDVAGDNSCFLHRGYASTRISAPAGTTPVST